MPLIQQLPEGNLVTTQVDAALGWARKYSIFQYPFVTACCGMEYMSAAASHYDMDRFGAGFPRFSPRQADLPIVNRLKEWGDFVSQGAVYLEEIKRELLKDSIFVFTPKGDVIELPSGSTPAGAWRD